MATLEPNKEITPLISSSELNARFLASAKQHRYEAEPLLKAAVILLELFLEPEAKTSHLQVDYHDERKIVFKREDLLRLLERDALNKEKLTLPPIPEE